MSSISPKSPEKWSFSKGLIEWGTPQGSIAKVLPFLLAGPQNEACLWLTDQESHSLYPRAWEQWGRDPQELYFLQDKKPLQSLRSLLNATGFRQIFLDTHQFLSTADFHFFSLKVRQQNIGLSILRPFFLSPKRGNPFCQYRLNSAYSLQKNQLQISTIKGQPTLKKSFSLKEVFYE